MRQQNMRIPRIVRIGGLSVAFAGVAEAASAHVKWFCTIVDVASPPVAPLTVLSPLFVTCCAVFGVLIFAGLWADELISRTWPRIVSSGASFGGVEDILIRAATAIYCLSLWGGTAVVPWGHAPTILTPELLDTDRLIGAVQIAVAALLLRRATCGLAACGLFVLFGVGIARYGVFHMTDFVYFLGVAGYLAASSMRSERVRRWRFPLLGATLGFSLMWTAVEKFLYPAWTAEILIEHPNLTVGLPVATVTVIAGFVEFSLAFYLVIGRGLLRLGAAALIVVFASAIPEFGALDQSGHLPIIAILLAICVHGATPLHDTLRRRTGDPAANAATVCGIYFATLSVMTVAYYGLQLTAARS